jgi:hypothetical protein
MKKSVKQTYHENQLFGMEELIFLHVESENNSLQIGKLPLACSNKQF